MWLATVWPIPTQKFRMKQLQQCDIAYNIGIQEGIIEGYVYIAMMEPFKPFELMIYSLPHIHVYDESSSREICKMTNLQR